MDSLVEPTAPPPPISLSTSQLNNYCGYYEPRNPRLQIAGFTEIITGGVNVFCENDTLYRQFFMDTRRPYIPVSEKLFRRPQDPEATGVFTETSDGKMVLATRGSYYERTARWKPVLYRILFFGAFIIMMSAIVYALFWIPLYVYKRLKRKDNVSKYIRMRLIPLFAVLSLVIGMLTFIIIQPSILELGQRSFANVVFSISTVLFAGFSVWSIFTAFKSFYKPVKKLDHIYSVILSLACFGMTLYLYFWGIIGLRLWEY